jgi:hypothetical protein
VFLCGGRFWLFLLPAVYRAMHCGSGFAFIE